MARKRDWSHLEKNTKWKYDWKANLFAKALPSRAFSNRLTANVMLTMQAILVQGFSTADSIKSYFRH
jgi:hypothetical protein